MKQRFNLITAALLASFLGGCSGGNSSPFTEGGGSTGSNGPVSDKNFTIAFSDTNPTVRDENGFFGGVEVTITINAGDKNNTLVNSGTVYIQTEWGILDNDSCQLTSAGSCSVKWTSDSDPLFYPPDDFSTFTAYMSGEESYIDLNGSGNFDDGDTFLRDLAEPYLDLNHDTVYTAGTDKVYDLDNNGAHTPADGFFNGDGCTHSTLCGTPTRIMISDKAYLNLFKATSGP